MQISLKTYAKQAILEQVNIHLQGRLPEHIQAPAKLTCDVQVEYYNDYYLVTLKVAGVLTIACQRCLNTFEHDYANQTTLAVSMSEDIADSLMTNFECLVAVDDEIDLAEILTDELYLYSPNKHENIMNCDVEIRQWIRDKSEIIETTLGL